jgi:AIPR protein
LSGAHKRNFLSELASAIREETSERGLANTGLGFNRVAAAWLGYELDDGNFVDGAGDRGIDFWFETDSGFEIFQCKSHELSETGDIDPSPFNNEGVLDLGRVEDFLESDRPMEDLREPLKKFRHAWEHAVSSRRTAKDPEAISVNMRLVLLGQGLTSPAQTEFEDFCTTLAKPHSVGNVPIEYSASLCTVDQLLEGRWRLENREWRDSKGVKKDTVDLHPEKVDEALLNKRSAVFYSNAVDLVRAYQEFGYQLFEPNVRCNITQSKVNAAIRESVRHRSTREEFRFLNNGVTIICQGFQKPSSNRPFFRVTKPGVVNGLQTVFALHQAYNELPQADKVHFETSCQVLVRLLPEDSLKDVNRLVRATNTQNPMQARNLRSNNNEQVQFERLFAELGWFYERKQGAWEAFAADPRRWRTLQNKSKAHFQVQSPAGRPRMRRVDNETLAQTWLSFTGFSEEAVQSRRQIFDADDWYDFIFQHTPKRHGFDLNHKLEDARQECLNQAPSPALMLASYLAREFARKIAPTPKENRDQAIKRLKIDTISTPKEKVQEILNNDNDFLLGQILYGMSFEFVELVGFVLYKVLDADLSVIGPRILANESFFLLNQQLDFDSVKKKVLETQFGEKDILAVLWWAFRHLVDEMLGGAWRSGYLSARNRTRFIHSSETRKRLEEGALQLHQFTQRTQLTRPWAVGIKPGKGLFGFVREVLTQVG